MRTARVATAVTTVLTRNHLRMFNVSLPSKWIGMTEVGPPRARLWPEPGRGLKRVHVPNDLPRRERRAESRDDAVKKVLEDLLVFDRGFVADCPSPNAFAGYVARERGGA